MLSERARIQNCACVEKAYCNPISPSLSAWPLDSLEPLK